MALKQSDYATGRRATLTSVRAGVPAVQELTMTVKAGQTFAAADIFELCQLPAFHDLLGVKLTSDALGGAITLKMGLLTGEAGFADNTRTLGSEIVAAQSVVAANTSAEIASPGAIRLKAAEYHRGIGVQFSADVAAGGADKLLTFTITSAPPSN